MEASLFYTGLVADLYAPLRSSGPPDPEPYARFIAMSGEPALELGCGDGEPLLDLRARGLDVEGVDSSLDMLDRCRSAAEVCGIEVSLHHTPIESMRLGRRYRTIFLAGATFNLLVDDDTASQALARIRDHLEPGGAALIPLFIPQPTPTSALGQFREAEGPAASVLRCAPVREERDEAMRLQTTVLRYERLADGDIEVLERPWVLHWHTQDGFRALAAAAGLTTVAILDAGGTPATETADTFVFWVTATDDAAA